MISDGTHLSLMTLLLLMRWYEDPTLARALRAGVCLGLALMTKTTAALLLLPALTSLILRLVSARGSYRIDIHGAIDQVVAALVPAAVFGGLVARLRLSALWHALRLPPEGGPRKPHEPLDL